LKKSMETQLPHDLLYRPKMGFAVPLARWFRGPLRGRVGRALLEGSTLAESGYFNRGTLKRLVDEHMSGARDHSTPIWAVLMFESFLRQSVIGRPARTELGHAA